jgi:NADH pyrophosphatase NudC (nudix superfamily)
MDSVEFDEFGRVYIRPTYYAGRGIAGPGRTPTQINKNTRFCVICGKKLSMYNTDKDNVCYSDSCEKKFQESKKNKKNT